MNFESFNLHPSIMAGVRKLGYTTPTPIQEQSIPPVIQGQDVIGLAQTGTGKTAAFVLPILERLISGTRGCTRALIISPTRELAEQTSEVINNLGSKTGLRGVTIYGGVSMDMQIRSLHQSPDIVVACPGRLLDHLWQGTIKLSGLEILVIDEADRMFDMGFLPDIKKILSCILHKRQTLLFSATMPDDIRKIASEILHNPVTVQIDHQMPAKTVAHALYPVKQSLKTSLLKEILSQTEMDSVLVFTRTKHRAERVTEQLGRAGFRVTSLQGNLSQNQRYAALRGFRNGSVQILVATDIAARGVDILSISHVINYDMPGTTEDYIHRIGRTGRVNNKGEAFTFVTGEDEPMVRRLETLLKTTIERRALPGFESDDNPKPQIKNKSPHTRTAGDPPRRRRARRQTSALPV
jgi:ATP-dependent RNA helicase RhlE